MPIPANTLLDEVEFDSDDKGASPGKKQVNDSQSQFCKLDNDTLRCTETHAVGQQRRGRSCVGNFTRWRISCLG
jgi:hypothetical protein